MTKPKINIDEAALQAAIAPGLAKAQAELDAQLQQTVREVRDEMAGQSADEVYAVLVERIRADVPNFAVNEENLRQVAAEIEAGTLSG